MRSGAILLLSVAIGTYGCTEAPTAKFPKAERPVSPIESNRWSDESSRNKLKEAEQIMDLSGVASGMTVADIGAGEGYYTVHLSKRVGPGGRVVAEDIVPKVRDALAERALRERLDNVHVTLGTPQDPSLPKASFDRIFLVHMYHEIGEPYEFLWNLRPALNAKGQVVVVDADRPTTQHGTPPLLLQCEFSALGYKMVSFKRAEFAGGYVAAFAPSGPRPEPGGVKACALPQPKG